MIGPPPRFSPLTRTQRGLYHAACHQPKHKLWLCAPNDIHMDCRSWHSGHWKQEDSYILNHIKWAIGKEVGELWGRGDRDSYSEGISDPSQVSSWGTLHLTLPKVGWPVVPNMVSVLSGLRIPLQGQLDPQCHFAYVNIRTAGITNSMDMNFRKLWEMVRDRGAWHTTVQGVLKSQTWLGEQQ